jgi:hypothetical protein
MDVATLRFSADAFCGTLPSGWVMVSDTAWETPSFSVFGASTAGAPITPINASVSLDFGSSECGNTAPGPRSITLMNSVNRDFPVTATLRYGTYYDVVVSGATVDGGPGVVPGNNGVATIQVTPRSVQPGPGVVPGSAPYADTLSVTVGPADSPVWTSTFPISWSLNGAVLAVGPPPNTINSQRFYVADSTSGLLLPIYNTGNEAATVLLGIPPDGDYTVLPGSPISVPSRVGVPPQPAATPVLVSTSGAPNCATQLTPTTTITLVASGPGVCQPLVNPVDGGAGPNVTLHLLACSGSFTNYN